MTKDLKFRDPDGDECTLKNAQDVILKAREYGVRVLVGLETSETGQVYGKMYARSSALRKGKRLEISDDAAC